MRSFTIKNSGYHAYFGLSSSALSQDTEFDVKEDATKAQIKSAFAKSLKTKKLNKKVLGEFISLVVWQRQSGKREHFQTPLLKKNKFRFFFMDQSH